MAPKASDELYTSRLKRIFSDLKIPCEDASEVVIPSEFEHHWASLSYDESYINGRIIISKLFTDSLRDTVLPRPLCEITTFSEIEDILFNSNLEGIINKNEILDDVDSLRYFDDVEIFLDSDINNISMPTLEFGFNRNGLASCNPKYSYEEFLNINYIVGKLSKYNKYKYDVDSNNFYINANQVIQDIVDFAKNPKSSGLKYK